MPPSTIHRQHQEFFLCGKRPVRSTRAPAHVHMHRGFVSVFILFVLSTNKTRRHTHDHTHAQWPRRQTQAPALWNGHAMNASAGQRSLNVRFRERRPPVRAAPPGCGAEAGGRMQKGTHIVAVLPAHVVLLTDRGRLHGSSMARQ